MDIWFKAKVDWGEALGLLSDTEAGRFAKALWKYAATGEAGTLTGREQMLFALVLADLRREAETPRAHLRPAQRGRSARRPSPRGKQNKQRLIPQSRRKQPKRDRIQKREGTEPRRKSQRRGARRAAGPPPRR